MVAAEELQKPHRMCLTDLREYMTQAAKTCSFLESLKFPFSTDVWMSAVRHRSEENNAYELGSVFPILADVHLCLIEVNPHVSAEWVDF